MLLINFMIFMEGTKTTSVLFEIQRIKRGSSASVRATASPRIYVVYDLLPPLII